MDWETLIVFFTRTKAGGMVRSAITKLAVLCIKTTVSSLCFSSSLLFAFFAWSERELFVSRSAYFVRKLL